MPKLNEPRGRPTRIGPTTIRPLRSKCCTPGCNKDATSWWPLLPGGPAFCNDHDSRATEYGADFSGPDDFDIPIPDWDHETVPWWFEEPFEEARKIFTWTNIKGKKLLLKDIDGSYLTNIINFLKRNIPKIGEPDSEKYWWAVAEFLEKEQKFRLGVVGTVTIELEKVEE